VLRRAFAAELLEQVDQTSSPQTGRRRTSPEPAPAPPASQRPRVDERQRAVPVTAAERAEPPRDPHSDLLYVYGVVPAGTSLPDDASLPRPLGTVDAAGLRAVVSAVPAADFSEEALKAHLEDLEWLSEAAWAHEQVLQALLPNPLVPFRLATVFASEPRVAQMLAERRAGLVEALDRVRGSVELGVKLTADAGRLQDTLRAAETSSAAGGPPGNGAAYLHRRRQERRAVEELHDAASRIADEVHALVSERACAAVRCRPHSAALSGDEGWMLLNGAYLVPHDRVDEMVGTADRLAERYSELGVRVELTGPWPPYNFVEEVQG
jgi:hypothetical protein